MKTPFDPRHKKREIILKKLYEYSFQSGSYLNKLIRPIIANINTIDTYILECAPEWPIKKLNKIDLAILRLSFYEMLIEKKNPAKVIIDEAIELAKQYGSQNSGKFVNGVLGTVYRKYGY